MRGLVLRLDAPLMSFGGTRVDQHGFIDRFPGTSMLVGLFANALGWEYKDYTKMQDLQNRLRYAARWDRAPKRLVDYHTVDLGQPKMYGYALKEKINSAPKLPGGWTTRGYVDFRSGASGYEIHQRYQHYWEDGRMTVIVELEGEGFPSIEDLTQALQTPKRPLFIGRKSCIPARPLLDDRQPIVEGDNLKSLITTVPLLPFFIEYEPSASSLTADEHDVQVEVSWPADLGVEGMKGQVRQVYDLRDWKNQIPSGSTLRVEGIYIFRGRDA